MRKRTIMSGMVFFVSRIAFMVVLTLSVSAKVSAQRITGMVRDSDGSGIPGANVLYYPQPIPP